MRGNLNTQFWLDNDTKHLENAFTRIFYKLTRGSAPRQFYKKYLYKAFSKYNLYHDLGFFLWSFVTLSK